MASSPLIFLGDTHGFIDDFKKQEEIIKRIKPEFVLAEKLENISLKSRKNYSKIIKNKRLSNMTSFEELEKLIRFCSIKGIKLIGIDFKNFGFDKNMQFKIINQEKLSPSEKNKLEKIIDKRENRHVMLIKKYLKKTKKPVLVIIGSWHLRDDSKLIKTFKNCRIIFPSDRKGNLLIEPSGNGEVFYHEKIK